MNFKIESYNAETIKEIVKENHQKNPNAKALIENEFPTFNGCAHTTIDMSEIPSDNHNGKMHTLSIKVSDDTFLTLSIAQLFDGKYVNVDAQFHSKNENRTSKAIHFPKNLSPMQGGTSTQKIDDLNLIALISEEKKDGF